MWRCLSARTPRATLACYCAHRHLRRIKTSQFSEVWERSSERGRLKVYCQTTLTLRNSRTKQQQEEERTTSNGRRKQCGVVYAVDCRERLVAFGHTVDCDPGSDQSDCATSYISITATIIVISHHRPLHIDPIRLGSSCAEWHSFVFCFSLSSLCAQLSALTHSLTHLFS
jgi:hypothetical protein